MDVEGGGGGWGDKVWQYASLQKSKKKNVSFVNYRKIFNRTIIRTLHNSNHFSLVGSAAYLPLINHNDGGFEAYVLSRNKQTNMAELSPVFVPQNSGHHAKDTDDSTCNIHRPIQILK